MYTKEELEKLSINELKIEATKKYKSTGLFTRSALYAQYLLHQDYISWGERNIEIKDNGFVDLDDNDIYYNGYDEKTKNNLIKE